LTKKSPHSEEILNVEENSHCLKMNKSDRLGQITAIKCSWGIYTLNMVLSLLVLVCLVPLLALALMALVA